MTFRNAVAALVVLAAATFVSAQNNSVPPVTTPGGAAPFGMHGGAAQRGPSRSAANGNVTDTAALHERMENMESTVNKMHALLKQMRAKAGPSRSKDPLVKANLEMWELMLGDLDKQLDGLRTTLAAREDLEARRAALYKQADAKAEAEAQRARAAMTAQSAGQGASAISAGQPASGVKTGQTPSGQSAPVPPAPKPK